MKAISSEGKLPFGIGGIKVSVAKIDGKVLTETLYINRQRSSNVYDLINDNGDIYYKVSMCWYDTRGIDIPNTVKPVDAINMVQDNSFMIYVDDGISKGYATLYMGRIIKLNNGRVVKRDYTTPVNGVIISPKVVALKVGSTQQLSATINPDYANDPTVSYSSSAPTIVEVDAQTGLAIARANGNANVTVTTHDGGFTDVCAFTVTTPVSGVVVSPSTLSLGVGKTHQLTATVSPDDASDKSVIWSSSIPRFATVSPTGMVTGIADGSTDVIATTVDGSFVSKCTVTVTTPVSGVVVSPKTASINVGSTQQLTATISPDDATNKNVTWSSATPDIATVNPTSGLVTGVANGTVVITATTEDGAKTDTTTITVKTPVSGVTMTPSTYTFSTLGDTKQLETTVAPATASNKAVSYVSSYPDVAKVSNTGLVTSVDNGTTTITVTTDDGAKTAESVIDVTIPVTGINMTPLTATLTSVGATQQLTASVIPDNARRKDISYTTSAEGVATVSPTGLITAVANGTANITATTSDGGFSKVCVVTVNIPVPVASVSVSPTSAKLTSVGDTQQLTPTVLPPNATNKAVTYSTSADGVATVSPTGLITAVANGTADITVTTADGAKTAKCAVTVAIPVPVASINVTPATKTLTAVNATQAMAAEVLPTNATNKSVTWSSSKPAVAKVDASTGVVTALTNGSANIIATAADGSGKTGQGVITVNIPVPVTAIDVTPKDQTLTTLNATKQMAAAITPSDATNKNVIWSSSAPEIAKVDANTGIVTALTNGTANIIATAADGSDVTGQTSVIVNIPVPVSSVSLTPKTTELSLSGTKTVQLVPEVLPAKATNKSVTYSADEPTKVSISDDGLVTALEEGSVIITVTTVDGNKTDTATVTISA